MGSRVLAALVAVLLAASTACMLTIPIATGIATSRHNREIDRSRDAGHEPAGDKQSVGAHVVTGFLVGAVLDFALLFGALASVELEPSEQ